MKIQRGFVGPALLVALALGCSNQTTSVAERTPIATQQSEADAEIQAALAKLDPADRTAAEAQGWCAVNNSERLGEMGTPVKLTLKGQPVFLCCAGCRKKAEADPDKTLAKVEELKAKKKAAAEQAPQ